MPPMPIFFDWGLATPHSHVKPTVRRSINSSTVDNSLGLNGVSLPANLTTNSNQNAEPVKLTANQRRKANVILPSGQLSAQFSPHYGTIIDRCFVSQPGFADTNGTLHGLQPPPIIKKLGSASHTPTSSVAPVPPFHPYSRASDLANTRSSVPSPQERHRANRAEEEKARQKKENAANARAAAAAARKRKSTRTGRNGSRRLSATANALPGAIASSKGSPNGENVDLPVVITQSTTNSHSPPSIASRGLQRTRSNGGLQVAIGTPNLPSTVAIASPLREVLAADDGMSVIAIRDPAKSVTPPSKQSRRKTLTPEDPANPPRRSARRANTTSPATQSSPLPEQAPLPATDPLTHARPLPRRTLEVGSTSMRRAHSANDGSTGALESGKRLSRNLSAGPEVARERSKREVVLPARMRDYDR